MIVRLKNMSELKEKHEQINQMLQSQSSETTSYFNNVGNNGLSNKSTAVDTERMRQHVQ